MINLNQSIAKVKGYVLDPTTAIGRDDLIEAIMHEGAGKDRKTLLKWLNAQVEALGGIPVERGDTITFPELRELQAAPVPKPTRGEPVYRPEKRGNIWMLYDVNNGEMRPETFEVKGDARAFIDRLSQLPKGVELKEPYLHRASA